MNHTGRLSVFKAGMLFLIIVLADILFQFLAVMLFRDKFSTSEGMQVFSIVFELLIIALPVTLFFLAVKINPFSAIRANVGINILQILLLLIISFTVRPLISLVTVIWADLWKLFGYEVENINISVGKSGWQFALVMLGTGIMPALCEEYLFRGALLRAFEPRGRVKALVLSSVMFGIIHMTYQQVPYAVLLGVVLGLVVYYTGSIWASITLHFFINGASVLIAYILERNPELMNYLNQESTSATGLEYIALVFTAVIFTAVTVGLMALLYLTGKRKNERIREQERESEALAASATPEPMLYTVDTRFGNTRGGNTRGGYAPAILGIAACVGMMALQFIGSK